MVLKKKFYLFEKFKEFILLNFYQNFEKREELFVLLQAPMLPKNEKLLAKDHPIINLQKKTSSNCHRSVSKGTVRI
jgi:hypothetical protein